MVGIYRFGSFLIYRVTEEVERSPLLKVFRGSLVKQLPGLDSGCPALAREME